MARIGKVTRNSRETFFDGGIGVLIPMRRNRSTEKSREDADSIADKEDATDNGEE